MDICEFSRKMLQAKTLTEAGLYQVSAVTMKNILQSLSITVAKTSDRKKLARAIISHVQQNCNCLIDIQKSKHFMIA